jgi:hypothetical protein
LEPETNNAIFTARRIDPADIVGSLRGRSKRSGHFTAIRQRMVSVEVGARSVEVLSRFNPTVEPWSALCSRLARFDKPTLVRATVLATEFTALDRLEIDEAIRAIGARLHNGEHVGDRFHLERALLTLNDLRACLASPVLVGEIAIAAADRLPDSFQRSIAATFTSDVEVLRQQGRVFVAGHRLLLGGFALERDPEGLDEALHLGLPLRGGTSTRQLRDLLTLSESPIGWPVPISDQIPTIPTTCATDDDVPHILRPSRTASTPLSAPDSSPQVALPTSLRTRHTVITGTWGSGKTTAMVRMAMDDLVNERGFTFIDPHGHAAEWLVERAEELGLEVLVLNADDPTTVQLAAVDRLDLDGSNRERIEQQIGHFADAIAASLPSVERADPRWGATIRSTLEVQSVHGLELYDAIALLNDGPALLPLLDHPAVSPLSRATLRALCNPRCGGDGAAVRGWAASKFHVLVSGAARRLIARPGQGLSIHQALNDSSPVIANLAALSTGAASLVGHLLLAGVCDAAIARGAGASRLHTCYVDEIHRFPVGGLSRVIVEGPKFNLGLVAAAQALHQLSGELADLAMSAGTHITFRATPDTAGRLGTHHGVPPARLVALADLHSLVSVQGQKTVPVTVAPLRD